MHWYVYRCNDNRHDMQAEQRMCSMRLMLRQAQERMIVEYDNARVLITDQKLETIKEVLPLLEQLTRINAPLLIIAEDVTGAPGRSAHLPEVCLHHTERNMQHVVYRLHTTSILSLPALCVLSIVCNKPCSCLL